MHLLIEYHHQTFLDGWDKSLKKYILFIAYLQRQVNKLDPNICILSYFCLYDHATYSWIQNKDVFYIFITHFSDVLLPETALLWFAMRYQLLIHASVTISNSSAALRALVIYLSKCLRVHYFFRLLHWFVNQIDFVLSVIKCWCNVCMMWVKCGTAIDVWHIPCNPTATPPSMIYINISDHGLQ